MHLARVTSGSTDTKRTKKSICLALQAQPAPVLERPKAAKEKGKAKDEVAKLRANPNKDEKPVRKPAYALDLGQNVIWPPWPDEPGL